MTNAITPTFATTASGAQAGDAAANPADAAYRAKLEGAAVQFEGMFIAQMLNEMHKATQLLKVDSVSVDRTADALLEHANRAVADSIAHQRAFGIADTLIAQMLPHASAARPEMNG
jgi:peptidoglycan hydrolase FlgJ